MKKQFVITEVKPYTMKELCTIYQISDKTMRKWLKPFSEQIGQRQGHIYNVAQVNVIFAHLGIPSILDN